jgi:hypothetical protein
MERRHVDVIAIQMFWALVLFALVAVFSTGCGTMKSGLEPTSLVEDALIAETAHFAGVLNVQVRGEITDKRYDTPLGRAAGWYSGGVAYYDREMVAKYVSIEPEAGKETARNVAAHEVAHAVHYNHDAAHWCLTARIATPTYPPPVAGLVCS